ncbi:MAG: response regulator [Magnetococcales bacterium]|nr:response regulator [Magnetococcales bacterium]
MAFLLTVVAGAALFSRWENGELLNAAEHRNILLARALANALGGLQSPLLAPLDPAAPPEAAAQRQEALAQVVASLTHGLPPTDIRIRDAKGALIHATSPEMLEPEAHDDPGFQRALKQVEPDSRIHVVHDATPGGETTHREIVDTDVPILDAAGEVAAIFELHTDVTELSAHVRVSVVQFLAVGMGVLGLLYLALFIIVRRAEGILHGQYQALEEAHRETERSVVSLRQEVERRHAVELELTAARQKSEEANQAKSRFLAVMSHEIRSPLNAVLGLTDLALNAPLSEKEMRQYLEIIHRSSESLLGLINGLLDLSRIEAGRLELEREPFDPREAMEEACELMAVTAARKGLELVCSAEPAAPARCLGDAPRLRQMMINLLSNAVKFTTQGEISVRLTLVERPEAGSETAESLWTLRFLVRDTGPGIPADKLERVFEEFTQADELVAGRFGGSGLGLAIVRRLAELMGGGAEARSTPGEGSEFGFTVRFPLEHARFAPSFWVRNDLKGQRILLADANPRARLAAREILTALGAEVDEVADGYEAVGLAAESVASGSPYDLAVLDCRLPRLSGLNLVESLARIPGWPGCAVTLLPTLNRAGDVERFAQLGSLVVVKPLRGRTLSAAVRQALGVPAVAPPAGPSRRAKPPHAPGGGRVLVVEDRPGDLRMAMDLLTQSGRIPSGAPGVKEAIARLVQDEVDLLLLDLEIPGGEQRLGGVDLLRRIRSGGLPGVSPQLPVVVLSAHVLPPERELALNAGADAFLAKPFKSRDLLEVLDQLAPLMGEDALPVGDLERRLSREQAVLSPVRGDDGDLLTRRRQLAEILPELTRELDEAARARSLSMIERATLRLKEAASDAGAERLRRECWRLIQAARKNQLEQLAVNGPLITAARGEIALAMAALTANDGAGGNDQGEEMSDADLDRR